MEHCKLYTTQSRLLTTLRKKASENIVGKGDNAGNQHFLLVPQCFLLKKKKRETPSFHQYLTHSHTMTPFGASWKQAF